MARTPTAAKGAKSAKKPKTAAKRPTRGAISVATNARRAVQERVAALVEAPLAALDSDANFQSVLTILGNKQEPIEVRLAALESLQAASFSVDTFASWRGDYIAALRKLVDDPDAEMRQRVLGLLAREKDGFAQKKLLEGLRNPDKALVPPEKALQLLSYDVHAEAYSAARAIVSTPPSDIARREALRLLAADATAAPLFEKLLRDKDELSEIRQISASALHAINPEKLQEHAREILLDASDFDDIKAASLTALTQFASEASVGKDDALLSSVGRLTAEASGRVQEGARQFLRKFGR
jgi:hypothetical protein